MDRFFAIWRFSLAMFACQLYGYECPLSCPYADMSVNLRDDDFDWNIAGVSGIPNVASVMEWQGIKSFGCGLEFGTQAFSRFPITVKGMYNRIYEGTNRDLDFFGNDKTGLFLKSRAAASRGELFDVEAEIGMDIFCEKNITLTPHIGYSLDELHLKIFDGFVQFNLLDPADVGPIKGLNSGYNARFSGPYVGVKAAIPLFHGLMGLGYDYYYPNYSAKGHANLRTDLVGGAYFHRSRGWGQEFFAEFQSRLQETLFFEITLKFGRFWTKKGRETEKIITDEGIVPIKIDVNRVQWSSRSISAHFIKRF